MNHYPLYIAWKIDLQGVERLDQVISRNRARRIQKAHNIVAASSYRFTREDVDASYLNQFTPLYEHHVGAKQHGVLFDVRGNIAQGIQRGKRYEAISLWDGPTLLGGQLYSVKEKSLSVAYRIFPYRLRVKLPISASYLAEQYLFERAVELKKPLILHGKDRNPYGLNSAIGVAEYKLGVGCTPYVSRVPDNHFQQLQELRCQEDTLVLVAEEPQQKITEGRLYTTRDPETVAAQYGNLLRQSTLHITLHPVSP